jgi:pimeloyl-ACP methyl ester carboxylesterase
MSVVLVHGAWHGAWAWDGVVAELARRGVVADAVELPFTGFADDVATVAAAIDRAGPGAVVCGHSYGGFVISAAARGRPVSQLVYLCAFMVDEDEAAFPLWFSRPVPLHGATVDEGGRSIVDPSKAAECFYGDADEDVVASIIPRLRSVPGAGSGKVDQRAPAWREVESTYVVCTRDRAIHPDVQRVMSRHATHVVEMDADHSPFVTQPAAVASLLIACGEPSADRPEADERSG